MMWCSALGYEQDALAVVPLRVEEESSSTRVVSGTLVLDGAFLSFAEVEVHVIHLCFQFLYPPRSIKKVATILTLLYIR